MFKLPHNNIKYDQLFHKNLNSVEFFAGFGTSETYISVIIDNFIYRCLFILPFIWNIFHTIIFIRRGREGKKDYF